MKQILKTEWTTRIFDRLRGVYGNQFKAKFSSIENGVDVGMLNAMTVWGEELGAFNPRPEAIAFALENLPIDHAPNAMEFRELCRRAPRKELAIEYKPEPVDPVKVAEITKEISKVVRADKNHRAWIGEVLKRKADGIPVNHLAIKAALELSE